MPTSPCSSGTRPSPPERNASPSLRGAPGRRGSRRGRACPVPPPRARRYIGRGRPQGSPLRLRPREEQRNRGGRACPVPPPRAPPRPARATTRVAPTTAAARGTTQPWGTGLSRPAATGAATSGAGDHKGRPYDRGRARNNATVGDGLVPSRRHGRSIRPDLNWGDVAVRFAAPPEAYSTAVPPFPGRAGLPNSRNASAAASILDSRSRA